MFDEVKIGLKIVIIPDERQIPDEILDCSSLIRRCSRCAGTRNVCKPRPVQMVPSARVQFCVRQEERMTVMWREPRGEIMSRTVSFVVCLTA